MAQVGNEISLHDALVNQRYEIIVDFICMHGPAFAHLTISEKYQRAETVRECLGVLEDALEDAVRSAQGGPVKFIVALSETEITGKITLARWLTALGYFIYRKSLQYHCVICGEKLGRSFHLGAVVRLIEAVEQSTISRPFTVAILHELLLEMYQNYLVPFLFTDIMDLVFNEIQEYQPYKALLDRNTSQQECIDIWLPFKTMPTQIIQNFLYLGSETDAYNVRLLKMMGVTHTLRCIETPVSALLDEHFTTLSISNVDDSARTSILKYLHRCMEFIGMCLLQVQFYRSL